MFLVHRERLSMCYQKLTSINNYKYKKQEDDIIEKTKFKYEVLLIYNDRDSEFVADVVYPRISSSVSSHSVCLAAETVPAGGNLPEEMSWLIRSSRRVIAIISDQFVSDPWCLLQFNLAMPDKLTEISAKLCGLYF